LIAAPIALFAWVVIVLGVTIGAELAGIDRFIDLYDRAWDWIDLQETLAYIVVFGSIALAGLTWSVAYTTILRRRTRVRAEPGRWASPG